MRIVLAPMEGLADDVLRGVLTDLGAYDWCVSEFIRVTDMLLPERVFRRICPELNRGAKTRAGTPVRLQLLGSDPACLADNAARAAAFDPYGIDLNFGCPAPTVVRHRGGSALLDEPELLHEITAAVRAAVPAGLPVTAKLRLGIRDTEKTLDCVRALEAGGASELVLHARTQLDGYRPPARWEWLGKARAAVRIPLIANGDIWTADDWRRCREISGCEDVMLGRGAVADPFLAWKLRAELDAKSDHSDPHSDAGLDRHSDAGWCAESNARWYAESGARRTDRWADLLAALDVFWTGVQAKVEPRHAPGRFKQWLGLLRRSWPEAEVLYRDTRAARHPSEITRWLADSRATRT